MALRGGRAGFRFLSRVITLAIRRRLVALFCKAGGATNGYQDAGFYVVGVDIEPQPNYCGDEFIQADALDWGVTWSGSFDAAHASPPCQAYTVLGQSERNKGKVYPDLLAATRRLLEASGLPWVIENVPGAPMRPDVVLCGSMFGMNVRRHRWFECSWPVSPLTLTCDHSRRPVVVSGNNHSGGFTAAQIKEAMEMPWMKTRAEVRQAIPSAYTEWIGKQLMYFLDPERLTNHSRDIEIIGRHFGGD